MEKSILGAKSQPDEAPFLIVRMHLAMWHGVVFIGDYALVFDEG